ncbi:MAG TPA: LysR substrate-binding domain-containing protein [Bacillota bacterium]|nr:LysR substrate-binding domain-containing protein [Bacillota bacterium]
MSDFPRDYHIEIYTYVANTRDIEEKLLKSELDIGIVEGMVKSPDLISIPEVEDFLVLVCGSNHPFAKKNCQARGPKKS